MNEYKINIGRPILNISNDFKVYFFISTILYSVQWAKGDCISANQFFTIETQHFDLFPLLFIIKFSMASK